jgi:imidazolonepropionase-like amidohydrolase
LRLNERAGACSVAEGATVIRDVAVFDAEGATLRPGLAVRIENGTIVALGGDVPSDGARIIEGMGRTLLPGLMDAHVHLTFRADPNEPFGLTETAATYVLRAAANARATLAAGFTTVRDLAAPYAINCDLAKAIDAGLVEGPRVIAAGRNITMTGGHGWTMGREADGADEVRKAVREQLKAGARVLKFMASGGVMTPGVDPRSPQLGPEELAAGIEEAHKAGVKTASHAQSAQGIRNVVLAGVDSVEHGIYLEDDVIDEMVRRGTFFSATLAAPLNIIKLGLAAGVAPHAVQKSEMVSATHIESFRRAVKAGVRLVMGTDAGTPGNRHGENAQELRLMVEGGVTPAQAIVAATANAAELLGIAGETGRVTTGLAADLLLVDGDPLSDITLLQLPERLHGVFKAGRLVGGAQQATL